MDGLTANCELIPREITRSVIVQARVDLELTTIIIIPHEVGEFKIVVSP